MKPDNAASLLIMPDIDGGLIGGAALDANSFLTICADANAIPAYSNQGSAKAGNQL
jgi:triosephosphate isomerase